jgi:hypothetical protein
VTELTSSVENYLNAVDDLNGAIRHLADVMPEMNDHVRSEFMPKAEEAAQACQQALDLIQGNEQADDVVLRNAITKLGVCIDQYAKTVTGVSTAYGQIAQ